MNDLQLANEAHQITQEIIEWRQRGEKAMFEVIKRLKRVRDKELWKVGGHKSFFSYLAQPEIAIERTRALKYIQVYEKFVEEHSLATLRVEEIGWNKLAKVVPHTNEDNYTAMLELASSNSFSDIDQELVEQHYITKSAPKPEFTTCPFCHKTFEIKERRDSQFPQTDYKEIIDVYVKVKDIQPQGNEYQPIQQSIKTMFLNGRTKDEIIAAIYEMEDVEYEWTMQTVAKKISEILKDVKLQPKKELSAEDVRLLKGVGEL